MTRSGINKKEREGFGSFIERLSNAHTEYLNGLPSDVETQMLEEGFSRFKKIGLPGKQDEYWKYSDLAKKLVNKDFKLQVPSASFGLDRDFKNQSENNRNSFDDINCQNGCVVSLNRPAKESSLLQLSRSLSTHSAIDHVIDSDKCFYLRYGTQACSLNSPCVNIKVADGVQATLIEDLECPDRSWLNNILSIELGEGAHLTHYVRSTQADTSILTSHISAEVGNQSVYEVFLLNEGAEFSKINIDVTLKGKYSEANIKALNLLGNELHQDCTFYVAHEAEDTRSKQTIRNIAADKSRLIFQGKAYVARQAQKTDAQQMCKSVLLSRMAEINAKPELEIYADDVLCAHGATCGELDEEALFYLKSRGLNGLEARTLLLRAFIQDLLDSVADEEVYNVYEAKLNAFLVNRGSI
ncbi:MAG: Fe-S cluster assembly protein SufD [Alphaproteobacteria bacterium]|nr:Fe-S cluster assembly protein SufD [Alphaproteobacteria bacterium]|tara:strand:+ start:229 stop:1464 length:1236 start_codon:yes stop_codon:yes gene_type:complete